MTITIEIDDKELKEIVTQKIAAKFADKWSGDRYVSTREFKEIAREILYDKKTKQGLIDSCVKMAATELCRKGLPKLLEANRSD